MTRTIKRIPMPMLAPFLVAAGLVLALAVSSLTGVGPSNNAFFLTAALAIVIGLVVGITSLFQVRSVPLSLRVLVGLLYAPTALFSALLAGF